MVEVDGRVKPACCTPAWDGAVINTDTEEVGGGWVGQRRDGEGGGPQSAAGVGGGGVGVGGWGATRKKDLL